MPTTAPIKDQLAKLHTFDWKGISVPTTTFKVSLRQDVAEHKPVDRDGYLVEGTGRASLEFTAKIPFRNGLVFETASKPFYPDLYREFMNECADRSTGKLVHPELGAFSCKLKSVESNWDAAHRDGVDVDAVWVETIVPDAIKLELEFGITTNDVDVAGKVLDAELAALRAKNAELDAALRSTLDSGESFADKARKVKAFVDQGSLAVNQALGKINSILYSINAVEDALESQPTAFQTAAVNTLQLLGNSSQSLRQELKSIGKTKVYYTVPDDTTVSGLLVDVKASVLDISRLNPGILARPVITRGTVVLYYE